MTAGRNGRLDQPADLVIDGELQPTTSAAACKVTSYSAELHTRTAAGGKMDYQKNRNRRCKRAERRRTEPLTGEEVKKDIQTLLRLRNPPESCTVSGKESEECDVRKEGESSEITRSQSLNIFTNFCDRELRPDPGLDGELQPTTSAAACKVTSYSAELHTRTAAGGKMDYQKNRNRRCKRAERRRTEPLTGEEVKKDIQTLLRLRNPPESCTVSGKESEECDVRKEGESSEITRSRSLDIFTNFCDGEKEPDDCDVRKERERGVK
ncbi:hypothetical protein SRHO_G00030920 [Serrasalmus rhombeus]